MELEACYQNFMTALGNSQNETHYSKVVGHVDTVCTNIKECPIVEGNIVFPVPEYSNPIDFARHVVCDGNFQVNSANLFQIHYNSKPASTIIYVHVIYICKQNC